MKRRVAGIAIAALLVVCLIAPFVRDQVATVHARGGGNPFIVAPYKVFGETAAVAAGLPSVPRRPAIVATALAGLVLSVPDFIQTIHDNILSPRQPPDAKVFAQAPDLWRRRAATLRQPRGSPTIRCS
jgi:hypothetical protein